MTTLFIGGIGMQEVLFKDELFAVVLAPRNPDFITYRLLARVSGLFGGDISDNPVVQPLIGRIIP